MTATRARFRVVALATTLAMITYLDRACIATLAPGIMPRSGADRPSRWAASSPSFSWRTRCSRFRPAWWADRDGTRSVLARIVIWWSASRWPRRAAFSYPVLLAVRFLFGAGEAGAWPCVARTFSRWIPRRERGTRAGHLLRRRAPGRRPDAGLHRRGGLLGCWPGMLSVMSWRGVFVSFGVVGFVWVAVWLHWFRDDPSEHPAVNAAELQAIVADRPREIGPFGGGSGYWRDADPQPEHDCAERHVHPELHDLLLLHHLAADLPAASGMGSTLGLGALRGLPLIVSMPGRSARRRG